MGGCCFSCTTLPAILCPCIPQSFQIVPLPRWPLAAPCATVGQWLGPAGCRQREDCDVCTKGKHRVLCESVKSGTLTEGQRGGHLW